MTPDRGTLGGLLALGAINALGGGIYGVAGAPGVPTEWLSGSPFTSYFVPGLILIVIVGGSLSSAAFAVLARRRLARTLAVVAGVVLLGWIAMQVAVIGYVSWLQPVVAVSAGLILVLAARLPSTTPQ